MDAVDECVYRGLRSCKRLRQPEYFDTWLTRILINVCNAELRRRKREVSMGSLPETAWEDYLPVPAGYQSEEFTLPDYPWDTVELGMSYSRETELEEAIRVEVNGRDGAGG